MIQDPHSLATYGLNIYIVTDCIINMTVQSSRDHQRTVKHHMMRFENNIRDFKQASILVIISMAEHVMVIIIPSLPTN